MPTQQYKLQISTPGRGTQELTRAISIRVHESGIQMGLCHIFVQHTSASLIICENADPDVQRDLETFMQSLVVDGNPAFIHQNEGPDDMSAHIRTVLAGTDLTLPVRDGRLLLGTWQGVFLWEHRQQPHERYLWITVHGD